MIKAVAGGATKLSVISDRTGLDASSCTAYLSTLIQLGILEKETAVGQKEAKRSVIRIADPFFKFWYRFVPFNMGAILSGKIQQTYQSSIKSHMHEYMGPVFEQI